MNEVVLITAVLITVLLSYYLYSRQQQIRRQATVQVAVLADFASSHLQNQRTITVFLPPGYQTDTKRAYKVLYINDGQDMEQLRLHETLANLYAQKRIEPLIVVAIPTNENRLQEYGTAITANAQELGKLARQYNRFVTEEVMPVIASSWRTLTGPENTAVLGASLGGLSAFDLAWNHPDCFGMVGVFSGSFWWRASETDPHITPNQLIAHEMVRRSHYRPGFRAWFEAGTLDEKDDRDNNGVIDAIQDTLELMDELALLGYKRGQDMVYLEVENGHHNYETWSQVLPDFLQWAFPYGGDS